MACVHLLEMLPGVYLVGDSVFSRRLGDRPSRSAARCGAASGLGAAIAPPGMGCPGRMKAISAGGGSETTGPTGCAAWITSCGRGGAKGLGGKRHRHCCVGGGGVPEADEMRSGMRLAGDETGPARQACAAGKKRENACRRVPKGRSTGRKRRGGPADG